MISPPFAHIAGIPLEETLGSLGPALLVAFGVAWAQLRARLRPVRSRASAPARGRRAVLADRSDSASSMQLSSRGRLTRAPRAAAWVERPVATRSLPVAKTTRSTIR
jgi:hypothetical protein